MTKFSKQTGKGGCFSTPKELNELNISLEYIHNSLSNSSNSISDEDKIKLEQELNELLTKVDNTNNTMKRPKNNNNAIKRQLGLSDKEYAELSKELEELEKSEQLGGK